MNGNPVGKLSYWIYLGAACLLAMGYKVALLATSAFPFNSDEAIVALMARHILHGERPVFFYGQAYMGSLDAFLVAGAFLAFGEQVWAIRAVQAGLYLGTLLTTAALGWAVFGDRRVGLAAAWLLAVPVINITLYTTVSLGGYGEMLLIGNLILLAALSISRDIWENTQRRQVSCLALGLLCGLGFWAFGLTLVYSLPALVFLSWSAAKQRPDGLQRSDWLQVSHLAGLVLLGALAGSAPWWLSWHSAGLAALLGELGGSAIAGADASPFYIEAIRHLVNLVLFGSTVIAGLRPPWGIHWLALPVMPLALGIWVGALAYASRQILRQGSQTGTGAGFVSGTSGGGTIQPSQEKVHTGQHSAASGPPMEWLLAGVVLTLVAGFLLTPFGADPSGRYFLPLGVVLALFIAKALVDWSQRWGVWVYGLAGIVILFNAWGTVQLLRQSPAGLSTQIDITTQADPRYQTELVEFLRLHRETRGYTNYWVAYPLAFLSDEELIYVPRLPYHQDLRYTARDDRYPPYRAAIEHARRAAYITTGQPRVEERIRGGLTRLGVGYAEIVIGDFRIFYELTRLVRPEELGL